MYYYLYPIPFLFLIGAVFYLFIGLKALIIKKPTIINSKFLYILIFPSLLPLVIFIIEQINTLEIFKLYSLLFLILPLIIIMLVIYCFLIKGYSIYCVDYLDFKNAIIFSLNNLLIKFEEKMDKIELIDLNNEINIPFRALEGFGMIKIKNKKDIKIFLNIITGIKCYFKKNNIQTEKFIIIYHIIFGLVFILVSIVFTIVLININN